MSPVVPAGLETPPRSVSTPPCPVNLRLLLQLRTNAPERGESAGSRCPFLLLEPPQRSSPWLPHQGSCAAKTPAAAPVAAEIAQSAGRPAGHSPLRFESGKPAAHPGSRPAECRR